MRVDQIDLIHIKLPLTEPYEISSGVMHHRESILVRMHAEGLVGYGESSPLEAPYYSYETIGTCWYILSEFMIPQLLGQEIESAADLLARLADIRGHNFARCGVETAWWDLEGKRTGQSLQQMLGGVRQRVESRLAIGIEPTTQELVDKIKRYLPDGYKALKIKIKPGWDVEPVRAIREEIGDMPLLVDANSAYSLDDLETFKELDKYHLTMYEQPLHYDDIVDHAKLQAAIETPVCLDESAHTLANVRQAIELKSCRIINIKIQRVGGLANALAIHNLCQEHGIPCWVGCMPESGIGHAQGLALASLPNFTYPTDIEATDRFFEQDVTDPQIEIAKDGTIAVPDEPGIGLQVVEEAIERLKVKDAVFH